MPGCLMCHRKEERKMEQEGRLNARERDELKEMVIAYMIAQDKDDSECLRKEEYLSRLNSEVVAEKARPLFEFVTLWPYFGAIVPK